jgi:hypothetical protein
MYQQLPHNMAIAAKLRAGIRAGVSMRVLHDSIKEMKDGPQSLQTLYKTYRTDIADARAGFHEEIGKKIVEKALVDGDMRALELVARSKMGWSPATTVIETEVDETTEDTGALDDLLSLLNLDKNEPEEE